MNHKPYQKPAEDQAEGLIELLSNRYSPRSFSPDRIEKKQLSTLLEAARWSPSSMNLQPWRFKVADKGTELFTDLWNTLMEGNKPWAAEASALIATFVVFDPAKPASLITAAHDLGLAVSNMTLQAESMGIGIHQMGGFSKNAMIKLLQLDGSIQPITVLAIGYYGDPANLQEPFLTREKTIRTRKNLHEILL